MNDATPTRLPHPNPVRLAIVGVGNCAAALVNGVAAAHANPGEAHEMNPTLGGLPAGAVQVVAAFDVDGRKVGYPLRHALTAGPNLVPLRHDVPEGPTVQPGPVLDGVAAHMAAAFQPCPASTERTALHLRAQVVDTLRAARAEVVIIYLPVGSEHAARWYALAAAEAGCAVVNAIPVFLTRDPEVTAAFSAAGLPIVGDDIKSQVGATIVHRALRQLFALRGVQLNDTYQLNVGGNTDFQNMLDRARLDSKKRSKTDAVQTAAHDAERLPPERIHVGPSDYVPHLGDTKIAFINMSGGLFGGGSVKVDVKLEVTDSPNSAGSAIDAIRAAAAALRAGVGGVLEAASAWCMKSPAAPYLVDMDALDACVQVATDHAEQAEAVAGGA